MAPGASFDSAAAASKKFCYNAEVGMVILGLSLGLSLGCCWWACHPHHHG